jgi:transcriptional antiterminator NusG
MIEEPLFAGYVFSHHFPTSRVSVLTTPGVIDIVGIGRTPVPIEEEEIAAVRALVRSGLSCEPIKELVPGKRVRLTGGPLTGTTGVIAELRKGIRLVVSIGLLQRSVLVEIDRDWVEPLPVR